MLHLDSDYTDSSTNTKTVTDNGDAAISTTAKFGAGSMFIQGTGYITVPDSDDWNLGTGDFTIEFEWRRIGNLESTLFELGAAGSDGIRLHWTSSSLQVIINGSTVVTGTIPSEDGSFHHICLIRTGTTVRLFIDGTQSGSDGTSSADITGGTSGVTIGAQPGGSSVVPECYYDEIRIVKGTAVYTANFVAPSNAYSSCTAPTTATTNYTSCGVGVSGAYSIY